MEKIATKYVAFFRGINVGGKGVVKMADLKTMLTNLALESVQTYVQSGNAVFGSNEDPDKLKKKIKTAFAQKFGFESMVTLRSRNEIAAITENPPFSAKLIEGAITANPKVEHVYVYFPDIMPSTEAIRTLQSEYESHDKLLCGKRELYLLCHESIRNSKMAMALGRLDIPMTSRNWKTLNMVFAMMEA